MIVILSPSAYSVRPPASAISCKIVRGPESGNAPGAVTWPVMKTLRLLICRTTTVTLASDSNSRRFLKLVTQHFGLQARRGDFANQRQRDLAVGPDRDIAAHVRLAPEEDAEDILGADDVVRRTSAFPHSRLWVPSTLAHRRTEQDVRRHRHEKKGKARRLVMVKLFRKTKIVFGVERPDLGFIHVRRRVRRV